MTEGAGITFYAILAIFPALAALVSIYGLVANPAAVSGQLDALSGMVPGGGMDILSDELKQLTSTGGGKLGLGAIIGILVALWSANGGTKAIFNSLNVVYDEQEKRGYIRRTLRLARGHARHACVRHAGSGGGGRAPDRAESRRAWQDCSASYSVWGVGHCCWSSSS